jgi:HSP20 family molecular chaperone IbpA
MATAANGASFAPVRATAALSHHDWLTTRRKQMDAVPSVVPFDFTKGIDDLIHPTKVGSVAGTGQADHVTLHLREHDGAYHVTVDLLDFDDLTVHYADGRLAIVGQNKPADGRVFGIFIGHVMLPNDAAPQSTTATYADGVLSVVVERCEPRN